MAETSAGDENKALGNEHFKGGDFLKAAACYTKAIKSDPANHVLYSNRAQAFLKLNKVARALEDAEKCIELAPDFVKGYHRKALALQALERKEEAAEVTMRACEMDPNSRELVLLGVQLRGKEFAQQVAAIRKARAGSADAHATGAPQPANAVADVPNTSASPAANGASATAGAAAAGGGAGKAVGGAATVTKSLCNLTPEEFATEIIRTTIAELLERRAFEPKVFMQPSPPHFKTRKDKGSKGAAAAGKGAGAEEPALGVMQISQAFDSPETLSQVIPAVRTHVNEKFKAQAAALAVLKSSIACPRVWEGKGSRWQFEQGCEGIFMQLEHPQGRRMWFTHIEDKSSLKIGATVSLDPEDFGILPRLF